LIRRAGGGNRDGVETRTGTSRSATEKEGSDQARRSERTRGAKGALFVIARDGARR